MRRFSYDSAKATDWSEYSSSRSVASIAARCGDPVALLTNICTTSTDVDRARVANRGSSGFVRARACALRAYWSRMGLKKPAKFSRSGPRSADSGNSLFRNT